MLFMKGTPDNPRCKFSRAMIEILTEEKLSFGSYNILDDPEVRQGLKEFSGQRTYPQLYQNGRLIGGTDAVKTMKDREGNLSRLAGASVTPPAPASSAPVTRAVEDEDDETEEELSQRAHNTVNMAQVVLFMNGKPEWPQCQDSRGFVELLSECEVIYKHIDVLEDPRLGQAVQTLASCSTFPQVWVRGCFTGDFAAVKKMADGGNLRDALKLQDINERLSEMVKSSQVFLFMKGSPDHPRCGFSRSMVKILRDEAINFSHTDVLQDPEVRSGVKVFSNWPTFPQLYVDGSLIGGIDIVKEMLEDDESLKEQLDIQQ